MQAHGSADRNVDPQRRGDAHLGSIAQGDEIVTIWPEIRLPQDLTDRFIWHPLGHGRAVRGQRDIVQSYRYRRYSGRGRFAGAAAQHNCATIDDPVPNMPPAEDVRTPDEA